MDLALSRCLNVPRFACEWEVSTRTVHRDLEAFRELGQRIVCERIVIERFQTDEIREYLWQYGPEVEPLFLCNSGPG